MVLKSNFNFSGNPKCLRRRRLWIHPRSQQWRNAIVPGFDDDVFIRNFPLYRVSLNYICRRLGRVLQRESTNYRLPVALKKRTAIALWRLATKNDNRSVSQLFGFGISSVCCCVQDFCNAVQNVLLPVHIKTPDARKLMEMATFLKKQMEGTSMRSHILILVLEEFPQDYFKRKGRHSTILQGVVDGRGLFWDVCVGFPGSVSC